MSNASISSVQSQFFNSNFITVAALVLLYYDYLLTLPAEVERFWSSRRITWASSFFYLNRYLSLLGHGPVAFQYFWSSSEKSRLNVYVPPSLGLNNHHSTRITFFSYSCLKLSTFHQYLAVVIQIIVGTLLIMRTYALYERKLWILLLICASGLAVIIYGTMCVVIGKSDIQSSELLPPTGCLLPISQEVAKRLASAWTGMLCFDILIFLMTVYKSLTSRRGRNTTLVNVLLRDGAVYFGVMVAAGLSVIVSFHTSPGYEKGLTTTLTNAISSTMISRLMLNLRDPKLSTQYRSRTTNTSFRSTEPVLTSFFDTDFSAEYYAQGREGPPTSNSAGEIQEDESPAIELTSRTNMRDV